MSLPVPSNFRRRRVTPRKGCEKQHELLDGKDETTTDNNESSNSRDILEGIQRRTGSHKGDKSVKTTERPTHSATVTEKSTESNSKALKDISAVNKANENQAIVSETNAKVQGSPKTGKKRSHRTLEQAWNSDLESNTKASEKQIDSYTFADPTLVEDPRIHHLFASSDTSSPPIKNSSPTRSATTNYALSSFALATAGHAAASSTTTTTVVTSSSTASSASTMNPEGSYVKTPGGAYHAPRRKLRSEMKADELWEGLDSALAQRKIKLKPEPISPLRSSTRVQIVRTPDRKTKGRDMATMETKTIPVVRVCTGTEVVNKYQKKSPRSIATSNIDGRVPATVEQCLRESEEERESEELERTISAMISLPYTMAQMASRATRLAAGTSKQAETKYTLVERSKECMADNSCVDDAELDTSSNKAVKILDAIQSSPCPNKMEKHCNEERQAKFVGNGSSQTKVTTVRKSCGQPKGPRQISPILSKFGVKLTPVKSPGHGKIGKLDDDVTPNKRKYTKDEQSPFTPKRSERIQSRKTAYPALETVLTSSPSPRRQESESTPDKITTGLSPDVTSAKIETLDRRPPGISPPAKIRHKISRYGYGRSDFTNVCATDPSSEHGECDKSSKSDIVGESGNLIKTESACHNGLDECPDDTSDTESDGSQLSKMTDDVQKTPALSTISDSQLERTAIEATPDKSSQRYIDISHMSPTVVLERTDPRDFEVLENIKRKVPTQNVQPEEKSPTQTVQPEEKSPVSNVSSKVPAQTVQPEEKSAASKVPSVVEPSDDEDCGEDGDKQNKRTRPKPKRDARIIKLKGKKKYREKQTASMENKRLVENERQNKLMNDPILDKHACLLWSSEHRRHFHQSHSECSYSEIDDMMRKAWEEMEGKDKLRYFQRAKVATRNDQKPKPKPTVNKPTSMDGEDDFVIDLKRRDFSDAFQRSLRKFSQMSMEEQDGRLRKTMNLFRQLLPRNIILKLTKELMRVIKEFTTSPMNEGLTKNELNIACRKILYEKLEIMKPKIIETKRKDKTKMENEYTNEYNDQLRDLISGSREIPLFPGEKTRSEKITQTLSDLKELETGGKLSVSGNIQDSPSYEMLLEGLRKPRESNMRALDSSVKVLRFRSPITDIVTKADLDSFDVSASVLENLLPATIPDDMPMIDSGLLETFFGQNDDPSEPRGFDGVPYTPFGPRYWRMRHGSQIPVKYPSWVTEKMGDQEATDEFVAKHFYDRASVSYNKILGHGNSDRYRVESPSAFLNDCLVAERTMPKTRSKRTYSRARGGEVAKEIYIRLNAPSVSSNSQRQPCPDGSESR